MNLRLQLPLCLGQFLIEFTGRCCGTAGLLQRLLQLVHLLLSLLQLPIEFDQFLFLVFQFFSLGLDDFSGGQ